MPRYKLHWNYGYHGIEPNWGTTQVDAPSEELAIANFLTKYPHVETISDVEKLTGNKG